jgi:hypothetical protein
MEGLKPMPLPVYVSQDLRMANPRFNELLERLNGVIAPMGERKALKESYVKVRPHSSDFTSVGAHLVT